MAGETLNRAHVSQIGALAPHAMVVNLYGATETGRALAFHAVDGAQAGVDEVIPIGRGIDGVQLLVLDSEHQSCGVGEIGQIGIRSACLSLGYHADPARNAERFVPNAATDDPRDRIYLTGDLGCYRADGSVLCLGRADSQIKIRGFRVELAEIQACLAGHPGVGQAAVSSKVSENGALVIEAFVRGDGPASPIDAGALIDYLAARLPDYMVPATIDFVDRIPLNENGKLDRRRLRQGAPAPRLVQEPHTQTERELLVIWRQLFQHDVICTTENFFRLGGNSLLATQLFVRVRQQMAVELSYRDFSTENSICAVARRIDMQRLAAGRYDAGKARRHLSL